jgi:hypothetical protein
VEGRAQKSPSRRYKSLEQWEVLILDHHCGYIAENFKIDVAFIVQGRLSDAR